MSYAPATFHAGTGEDFFRKEGILVDGMAPLISARYTFPTPDSNSGTAITVTNSVGKAGAVQAVSWTAFDLPSAKSKILAVTYMQPSTTGYIGWGIHDSTTAALVATIKDSYQGIHHPGGNNMHFGSYNASGGFTLLGTDTTFFQENSADQPVMGLGLFADGTDLKMFVKSGTGQWFQILTASAATLTSFHQVYFRQNGLNARFICPMFVWGS